MKVAIGGRVQLTRPVQHLPAGSAGTVEDVFPLSESYNVGFDTGDLMRVPESALQGQAGAQAAAAGLESLAEETVAEFRPKGLMAECIAALPDFRNEMLRSQQFDPRVAPVAATAMAFTTRGAFSAFASPSTNVHATGVGIRRRGGRLHSTEPVLKVFVFDKLAPEEMGGFSTAGSWRGMPIDIEHLPIQVVRAKASARRGGEPGAQRGGSVSRGGGGGRGGGRKGSGRGAGGGGGQPLAQQGVPAYRQQQRPIVGGLSISPLNASYVGTLGCFLRRRRVDTEVIFALSNNHVLADVDHFPRGTSIVQPGPEIPPYVTVETDVFASLHSTIPIVFPAGTPVVVNRFDAAIATVTDLGNVRRGSMFGIPNYNPRRILSPYPGMRVIKAGRTTGVTKGVVTAIRVDGIQVNYGTQNAPRLAVFDDTLEIEGDDGKPFSGCPTALLFAGDGVHTTACEMGPLCRRLRAWPV
jgi:hypothetical protein